MLGLRCCVAWNNTNDTTETQTKTRRREEVAAGFSGKTTKSPEVVLGGRIVCIAAGADLSSGLCRLQSGHFCCWIVISLIVGSDFSGKPIMSFADLIVRHLRCVNQPAATATWRQSVFQFGQ